MWSSAIVAMYVLSPLDLRISLTSTHTHSNVQSFVIEKEEYTPGEFVKKYSERFPLHVRVSKGFYGNSETTSVSEGDTFNIHFIKKTKVCTVCM